MFKTQIHYQPEDLEALGLELVQFMDEDYLPVYAKGHDKFIFKAELPGLRFLTSWNTQVKPRNPDPRKLERLCAMNTDLPQRDEDIDYPGAPDQSKGGNS